MRILYVTQYYASPAEPGSLRHSTHVRHLVKCGHSVTVLTTYVLHKQTDVREEYRNVRVARESLDGATVIKVRSTPTFEGFIGRLRNYLSFMLNASAAGLRQAGSFDVVLASSPSLFVGLAGWMLAIAKRARFVLEVRDLWPQSAIALGILRNRCAILASRWLERLLYRRAWRIIAVTEGIADTIKRGCTHPDKVHVIPNGIDARLFADENIAVSDSLRTEAGKPFVVMYAGSHGMNNSLDLMISTATKLREHRDIAFVLIGQGDRTATLKAQCEAEQLENVVFLGARPRAQVPAYLMSADVLFWPVHWSPGDEQLLEVKRGARPNKLLDYLAAGKPILTSAPPDSEGASLLNRFSAGIVVAPDPAALSQGILRIQEDAELRSRLAQDRQEAIKSLDRARMAATLERVLRGEARGEYADA